MKLFKEKQGFTLIEILVVVLIIGILAAVALPQYQLAVEKSKAAEALTNMRTIVDAVGRIKLLNDDGDIYTNHNNWDIDLSGGTWKNERIYITDNFRYNTAEDNAGIDVVRCEGKCNITDDFWDNYLYELWVCYDPFWGGCPFICFADSAKGKRICKALEGLGVENRS